MHRPALLALLLATAACSPSRPGNRSEAAAAQTAGTAAGIDPAAMDKAVAPGDDFFAYTNGGWVKKNPDAARKFVAVTMKAVKWSFANPKEAVKIFVDTYPKDVSPQLATAAWAQIVKYDSTRFVPNKPAGWMDPGLWQSYQTFLLKNKFLKTQVDLNTILTRNQYVGG